MAVKMRRRWDAVGSGTIEDNDLSSRQFLLVHGETKGLATSVYLTHDGTSSGTSLLYSTSFPPWPNVTMADRTASGWSAFGNYGVVYDTTAPSANLGDFYAWTIEYDGGDWKLIVYTGGKDAEGNVIGAARGRKFYAYCLVGPDDS